MTVAITAAVQAAASGSETRAGSRTRRQQPRQITGRTDRTRALWRVIQTATSATACAATVAIAGASCAATAVRIACAQITIHAAAGSERLPALARTFSRNMLSTSAVIPTGVDVDE